MFPLSTFNKVGSAAALFLLFWYLSPPFSASVVVDFEVVQFRGFKSPLGVGSQMYFFMLVSLANSTLHRLLRVAC